MKVNAQELRRRWSDKTNAVFGAHDRYEHQVYAAADYEREFDFKGCKDIVFSQCGQLGTEVDVILMTQGSGHMTLPAGVQVVVNSGYAKCTPAASAGGGSVVGMGTRAPAPSRASGYAPSSAGSAFSGAAWGNPTAAQFGPSRDTTALSRPSTGGSSHMSSVDMPSPRHYGGRRSSADSDQWQVVQEMNRDDAGSIAPEDSISSVGTLNRRHTTQHFY